MPRATRPVLEVRYTRHGAWVRLAANLTDAPSALKLGDLVAADSDDTGTWPRHFGVRVLQGGKTLEEWAPRDKGPVLAPLAGTLNGQAYLDELMSRTRGTTLNPETGESTLVPPAPRKRRTPKPEPTAAEAHKAKVAAILDADYMPYPPEDAGQ